ncbi:Bug family tripartite tricarboxylate transporter substrate binding protein [Delftia sp. PS-11]|uniref:Bug family tripartite tricarboxylate transporter substrate binding protein n=1 Tax=Delftia sp. PS-11 TaxID=2767222 RepID=UPI0024585C89|nr:tripartite tricarboxylate transporter substrate binding protein [Delftia sp. PS-11]
MRNPSRRLLVTLVLAGLSCAASAQQSGKPLTLVVPFAPGGGSDTSARLLSQALSSRLGQTVIIENKPGAAGVIGADQVARAQADGNTLLLGNIGTQSINPILYKKLPYDARTAFAPVSLVAELPQVLLVHPGVQAKDVAGLIALLKAQPGKFSYSTSGPGGSMHLAGEMFKSATQTDIQHVAYRGGGPAIVDLLSGHVQISFATVLESLGHIKAGKLRALAVTGDQRVPALPDVPTVAETVPGFKSISWVGVLAPAKTPQATIDRLAAAIRDTVAQPEITRKLNEQGAVARTTSPQQFAALIQADNATYAQLITEKGIKAE